MKIRRPSDKTIKLLKMLTMRSLVIVVGAASSPRQLSRIFRDLEMLDNPKNRKWIRRKLYAMHDQRYVDVHDGEFSLTDLGNRMVKENKMWSVSIPTPKQWDGNWHIVVFDIPSQKSPTRIPFTRHLKNLGFVYYQRSVWLHAYPCEDEVRDIAIFLDILPFVSFIKATHVDGSHEYRKHFKLPH